jgi:hypothetical protein
MDAPDGIANSVTAPLAGSARPTKLATTVLIVPAFAVNHRPPSGPAARAASPTIDDRLPVEERHGERADLACGGDASQPAADLERVVGEPDGALCQLELADLARGRDPADSRQVLLGEPQVAVGAGRERAGQGGPGRDRELAHGPARRDDPADEAGGDRADGGGGVRGEPQVAVGPGGQVDDADPQPVELRDGEHGDLPRGGDPPDLGAVVDEPHVVVGPFDGHVHVVRRGVRIGQLGDLPRGRDPADRGREAGAHVQVAVGAERHAPVLGGGLGAGRAPMPLSVVGSGL